MDFMQKQQQLDQQQAQQQMQETQQIRQQAPQQINQQAPQQIRQEAQQQIQQQAQMNLPPAHAHAAAAGEAVQQMAPARKTYKARRAEKRHAREAREHCPVGDIVTYDIKQQLKGYYKQNRTLFNRNFPFLGINPETNEEMHDMSKNLSGVDRRVLQIFSHTFRTDGAAVAADEKYQREGQAFYDAFCSTDYVRRAPYLQRMAEEVLSFNLKEDMFSDKNMRSNAAEYKSIADRIVYMENVMKDKNNAFFFDSPLCPVKKEDLKKALDIAGPTVSLFKAECEKRGVEPDYRDVPYISEQSALKEFSRQADFFAGDYKGKPEEYQSFIESIKSEETQKPTPEMYQQIRSLIEGDVQKLLDCDAEKLNALSEEELRKLYSVSLGVDKCLTLKHPEQTDNTRKSLTLKDDLIGQRKLEYEYKLALLRGLVERADGFKKQGKQTIKAASERYKNQKTPGTPEFQEFFDYLRISNIASLVTIDPKYNNVAKEYYTAETLKEELPGKMDEVKKRLEEEFGTGEMAAVVERLKSQHYFSLKHTKDDLERLKKPVDIGEALFRTLSSFLKLEATETLLTPEQLRRMLLNLGAGGGLTPDVSEYEEPLKQAIERKDVEKQQELEKKKKDAEEKRDEAIEKNDAGLDTLREVLAAQYDMLERKYGNGIEQMTIKEITEHYGDIAKDFANAQVDYHLATRFPGFIRENNPDDERLINQILYYNQCGFFMIELINSIGSNIPAKEVSDEMIKDLIKETLEIPQNVNRLKAREALMKNNSFQHPLDWSQKVKNPADAE